MCKKLELLVVISVTLSSERWIYEKWQTSFSKTTSASTQFCRRSLFSWWSRMFYMWEIMGLSPWWLNYANSNPNHTTQTTRLPSCIRNTVATTLFPMKHIQQLSRVKLEPVTLKSESRDIYIQRKFMPGEHNFYSTEVIVVECQSVRLLIGCWTMYI